MCVYHVPHRATRKQLCHLGGRCIDFYCSVFFNFWRMFENVHNKISKAEEIKATYEDNMEEAISVHL